MKENLLIVISSASKESILKFPLLYSGVSIPRGYWKRVHIMFWGESIQTVAQEIDVQKKIKEVLETGVEFSSCIVCCQEYGVVETFKELHIEVNHTGELLTKALKSDQWATMTI